MRGTRSRVILLFRNHSITGKNVASRQRTSDQLHAAPERLGPPKHEEDIHGPNLQDGFGSAKTDSSPLLPYTLYCNLIAMQKLITLKGVATLNVAAKKSVRYGGF